MFIRDAPSGRRGTKTLFTSGRNKMINISTIFELVSKNTAKRYLSTQLNKRGRCRCRVVTDQ